MGCSAYRFISRRRIALLFCLIPFGAFYPGLPVNVVDGGSTPRQ
jgi:hypothetical protein